jgi:predicted DNA-binding transcriptional regulator YafY
MDIMKYGGDCKVVEPKALRERVADEFERAATACRLGDGIPSPASK